MHFANMPPDYPEGKVGCCGFNVYSVVVQIEILYIIYIRLKEFHVAGTELDKIM